MMIFSFFFVGSIIALGFYLNSMLDKREEKRGGKITSDS
jgi:hypothetical protein